MKIKALLAGVVALTIVPGSASASLNGRADFSEPRIVAVSMSSTIGSTPWANGSGYLYSPRIVFSAGHMKDKGESTRYFVSQPNQALAKGMKTVKVTKILYPDSYNNKTFGNDFSVLVLEEPLAKFERADLITPEILASAIAQKLEMKIMGFGVYQDKCLQLKKATPPCNEIGDKTSLVPRSSFMKPWTPQEIRNQFNKYQEDLADHLFMTAPYKAGPCGGDSGGSTTVVVDGRNYYVGTVPPGFWNAYACGQSGGAEGETLGYTAPVYKFLDLIASAEEYVSEHPYISASPKTNVSPVNSKYQYIIDLAKTWSKGSIRTTAVTQCTSARDAGSIYKNGKLTKLKTLVRDLQRDLNTYPGFKACLDGFK